MNYNTKDLCSKYFNEFNEIGSRSLKNTSKDLDYLVIIKSKKSLEGLLCLIDTFHKMNKRNIYSIISDSYFHPFISQYKNKPIIHLIFYYSEEAFEIDYFSRLIKEDLNSKITLPPKQRLSIILAMQDTIKMWLLLKLNTLHIDDFQTLNYLIHCQIDKWLNEKKNEYMNKYEINTLKMIVNDLKRISC